VHRRSQGGALGEKKIGVIYAVSALPGTAKSEFFKVNLCWRGRVGGWEWLIQQF